MHTRSFRLSIVSVLVASLVFGSACSTLTTLGVKKGGLERVDELLSHVERVQVESMVTKERSLAALESLRALVAPEFKGDAVAAHAALVSAVKQSADQAESLQDSVRPLRKTGEAVLVRWAEDLESFGNLAMRQRSQERLEETRKRYDAILAASVSAQLACDSFNGDLSDHALFLEHDYNATSVALMAQELEGLRSRSRELAKRLDACSAACQAYVEFSAPRAQVSDEETPPTVDSKPAAPATPPAGDAAPAKKPTPKKKNAPKTGSKPAKPANG